MGKYAITCAGFTVLVTSKRKCNDVSELIEPEEPSVQRLRCGFYGMKRLGTLLLRSVDRMLVHRRGRPSANGLLLCIYGEGGRWECAILLPDTFPYLPSNQSIPFFYPISELALKHFSPLYTKMAKV